MFSTYFANFSEVRPEFEKEFVSIFSGWLGSENLDQLDNVTEQEFQKFNVFLRLLYARYKLYAVNLETQECTGISTIDDLSASLDESHAKESAQFTRIVIPQLGALYEEHWDFTWILWHRGNGAVEALEPLIHACGLYNWRDSQWGPLSR